MTTDFERYISINQVIPKSIELWFGVKKILLSLSKQKDRNEKILPHKRVIALEKRLDEIGEKIENLDDIIFEAAINSLHEFEICNRVNDFSNINDRERSYNNQQTWEACFVQNYAIRLAEIDIDKLNDCVSNPNGHLYNSIVNQLVNTIELIREYYEIFKKIEITKAPQKVEEISKELEQLTKILEAKDEEIEARDIQNRMMKKLLDERQNAQFTGLKSTITVEQAKKLCTLLRGEYIAHKTLEINFAAVFSNEPLPEGFIAVEWIKKQKRNKEELNKKAVFDLLNLTGVDTKKTDLPTINRLICGTLTHSNWNGNKGSKSESEAYIDLKAIISQL